MFSLVVKMSLLLDWEDIASFCKVEAVSGTSAYDVKDNNPKAIKENQ